MGSSRTEQARFDGDDANRYDLKPGAPQASPGPCSRDWEEPEISQMYPALPPFALLCASTWLLLKIQDDNGTNKAWSRLTLRYFVRLIDIGGSGVGERAVQGTTFRWMS